MPPVLPGWSRRGRKNPLNRRKTNQRKTSTRRVAERRQGNESRVSTHSLKTPGPPKDRKYRVGDPPKEGRPSQQGLRGPPEAIKLVQKLSDPKGWKDERRSGTERRKTTRRTGKGRRKND